MGTILKTVCINCGETASFLVGNGIKDVQLDWVLKSFKEDERKQIQNLLADSGETSMWSIDRKLAYCRQCRKWKVLPVFRIEADGASDFRIIYGKCDICGKKAEYYDAETVLSRQMKLYCPKCGKRKLSAESAGMWD